MEKNKNKNIIITDFKGMHFKYPREFESFLYSSNDSFDYQFPSDDTILHALVYYFIGTNTFSDMSISYLESSNLISITIEGEDNRSLVLSFDAKSEKYNDIISILQTKYENDISNNNIFIKFSKGKYSFKYPREFDEFINGDGDELYYQTPSDEVILSILVYRFINENKIINISTEEIQSNGFTRVIVEGENSKSLVLSFDAKSNKVDEMISILIKKYEEDKNLIKLPRIRKED